MTKEEKGKAIKTMEDTVNKDFGPGSVMSLGDKPILDIDVIPTGSLNLDIALGVGGLPKGRIIEIYGPESSGKTTLAIHVIAEAQKKGGMCAIIDAEHAFDSSYAQKLGVDIDNLLISQPDYGEQALEIAYRMVATGALDVVVVDSVAALVPKAEIDGEMGENKIGLHARLMSQALRKLASITNKTNTCLIFINQLREKIGVMFGSPEVTTGGNALKFFASVRLDVRRSVSTANSVMMGDEMVGNQVSVKVVKNKVAPPFKKATFDILYGKGINSDGEILDLAIQYDIIQKSGSWYSTDGNKIGQGSASVEKLFADNPDFFQDIKSKVINKIKNNN